LALPGVYASPNDAPGGVARGGASPRGRGRAGSERAPLSPEQQEMAKKLEDWRLARLSLGNREFHTPSFPIGDEAVKIRPLGRRAAHLGREGGRAHQQHAVGIRPAVDCGRRSRDAHGAAPEPARRGNGAAGAEAPAPWERCRAARHSRTARLATSPARHRHHAVFAMPFQGRQLHASPPIRG
jgi:hypothetical protein